ncbi:hypothetical protein ACJMK2_033810 [Sinanodonta woodiana]|uniref:Caspase family p20 domain-containing protein n=1 Tax=Sinanodonta woodiana TaxID=1069815 RepID=A0ABD3WTS8_SINWO
MTSTKDSYDCSHKDRGYALIFANEDVEPKRQGALEDEMYMDKLFGNLKFKVLNRSDVSAEDIVQTLNDVLADEEFLKNSDCFVFVISTHGKEILSLDGKIYQHLSCIGNTYITTQKIVSMVSECEALKGKPKLFFIQACRFRGKIDRNTPKGRDPGHKVYVKKDETNESPKHSPAQLSVGHTMGVRSDEEARQKLENLAVNCDDVIDDQGNTIASQNSVSATTDEDSQLSVATNVNIGHSMPDSSFPKSTADAGQNSASTSNQASTDPIIHQVSCPKDTLIMYAIPPGYFARRQSDGVRNCSVMLDKLKNVLENITEEKSLLAALTEVTGRVARDYEYCLGMSDYEVKDMTEEERREKTLYKIVPQINHRLLHDFYFTKKDD